MELHNLNQELDNINLDKPTKHAILQLIDIKTNSDMKEVIAEMKNSSSILKAEMQNSSSILRTEMQNSSGILRTEMQAEMKSFNKEIKVMYWVIGGGMTLITIFLAIIALKK